MITFDPPISLASGLAVTAYDGASYVLSDGRTFWAPAPAAEASPETIAAEVEALIANPPPPPDRQLTPAEAEALLDRILDGWAQAWGYADAARAVTYVGDPEPQFNSEGLAIRNARSALWSAVRAAAQSPNPDPFTEAAVRAFAAEFEPTRPTAP